MQPQATDPTLFFSKSDPEDPRLGEHAIASSTSITNSRGVALLGYMDDEGIKLNGGRPGAALAPVEIRRFLYRMTPPRHHFKTSLFDLGNLVPSDENSLEQRHAYARQWVSKVLSVGSRMITLGGGHDYGFPDAAAFLDTHISSSPKKPIVINFDAHLDVRPSDKNFNSGTPFRRLLTEFAGHVDFYEVGIQPQCNSVFHRDWATTHGATIIDLKPIAERGLCKTLQDVLDPDPSRPLWISLDMDCFSAAYAPGCSQVFSSGIKADEFLTALSWLQENFAAKGMGIYEVSPPLDQDNQTSRWAAVIAHHFICAREQG